MQSINIVSPFFFTAFASCEISSIVLRKLLLAIEIHVTVCGLQATHRPTIVAGLLRQSCIIKYRSLLAPEYDLWSSPLEACGASFVNFLKIEDFRWCMPIEIKNFDW